MENIPLQARLKRELHRKIAYAQDLIVKEVYSIFNRAVLHGGTAIWRCYGGRRFSEDLDFYLDKNDSKIEILFENLKKVGFNLVKKKVSDRSIYSELELDRTFVRLEATFQKIAGILYDYEMSDGNFIKIYSLGVEEFLDEKANTYIKRRKIRDLWDIYFLLNRINEIRNIKGISLLIKNYESPIDKDDLKVIILEGLVPSADEMMEYIRGKWQNKNI